MAEDLQDIRDKILTAALSHMGEKGSAKSWSWLGILEATQDAGYADQMAEAVFPGGLNDAVAHFADFIDRKMLAQLASLSIDTMRVRDRISTAILARLEILDQMKAQPTIRATLSYWALPLRVLQGQRVLWRTTDRIWAFAGDTSQDYNHYTKRALLSSVLMATTLVWIDDKSEDFSSTRAFLDRRIENVMDFGKTLGQTMSKFAKRK